MYIFLGRVRAGGKGWGRHFQTFFFLRVVGESIFPLFAYSYAAW